MSSDTKVSVTSALWAGRILATLSCLHLALTGVANARHVTGWLTGGLWMTPRGLDDLATLGPDGAGFWIFWGSFAVPLGLLGAFVARMAKIGQVPPPYVAVVVAIWALVAAVVFEPSPFVLGVVPAAMLLAAWRKQRAAAA
ncbi:DUF6463 family protein [Nonomuraea sp. NPDC000554]|uniref:DUF6463 family protein n=1 Tax=Nonomuraea sp. NPDC000554 TaxID=3154259 RepID=UPI00332FF99D